MADIFSDFGKYDEDDFSSSESSDVVEAGSDDVDNFEEEIGGIVLDVADYSSAPKDSADVKIIDDLERKSASVIEMLNESEKAGVGSATKEILTEKIDDAVNSIRYSSLDNTRQQVGPTHYMPPRPRSEFAPTSVYEGRGYGDNQYAPMAQMGPVGIQMGPTPMVQMTPRESLADKLTFRNTSPELLVFEKDLDDITRMRVKGDLLDEYNNYILKSTSLGDEIDTELSMTSSLSEIQRTVSLIRYKISKDYWVQSVLLGINLLVKGGEMASSFVNNDYFDLEGWHEHFYENAPEERMKPILERMFNEKKRTSNIVTSPGFQLGYILLENMLSFGIYNAKTRKKRMRKQKMNKTDTKLDEVDDLIFEDLNESDLEI